MATGDRKGGIAVIDLEDAVLPSLKAINDAAYIQKVPAPTGVLALDQANIQAAHDALPGAGGFIQLGCGTSAYQFSTLSLTKQVAFKGMGAGGRTFNASTKLQTAVGDADAITSTVSGSVFEDFMVECISTTPTAGAGIALAAGEHVRMHNVTVRNFYDDVRFDTGFYYSITECDFQDPVRSALRMYNGNTGESDHGDQLIAHNVFGGYIKPRNVSGAVVYWEPAGGLKFIGNKVNGSLDFLGGGGTVDVGVDIKMPNVGNTSVCTIVGNSIEGWNTAGIRIGATNAANTKTLAKVVITGNEIAGNSGTAVTVTGPSSAYPFREIVVGDNSMSSCTNGVYFSNCESVALSVNVYRYVTSTIVQLGAGVKSFSQIPQNAWGSNLTLYAESSMDTGAVGPFACTSFDLQRELGLITSNSVYTTLYKIQLPQYAGGAFSLVLAGQLSGVGSFVYRRSGVFTRETGGITLTLDAATTGGGTIDVTFDVATVSNEIWVGVKRNTTNGVNLCGRAHLTIDGTIGSIVRP